MWHGANNLHARNKQRRPRRANAKSRRLATLHRARSRRRSSSQRQNAARPSARSFVRCRFSSRLAFSGEFGRRALPVEAHAHALVRFRRRRQLLQQRGVSAARARQAAAECVAKISVARFFPPHCSAATAAPPLPSARSARSERRRRRRCVVGADDARLDVSSSLPANARQRAPMLACARSKKGRTVMHSLVRTEETRLAAAVTAAAAARRRDDDDDEENGGDARAFRAAAVAAAVSRRARARRFYASRRHASRHSRPLYVERVRKRARARARVRVRVAATVARSPLADARRFLSPPLRTVVAAAAAAASAYRGSAS